MAISTACGMLDYVVVETASGGQACIEFLKKHNLGRVSFIILEQGIFLLAVRKSVTRCRRSKPRWRDQ